MSATQGNYAQRKIDLTLDYGKGDHGEGGYDTFVLRGLRISAQVYKTGVPTLNHAQLRIYGLSLDLMNRFSTLGKRLGIYERNNVVSISAGDVGQPPAMIFKGVIQEAWADFEGAPDSYFVIESHSGSIGRLKPITPTSYAEPVDAAVVIQTLAISMGYNFENNNGVSVILANAYYPGTAMDQVEQCAREAHIGVQLDDTVIAIWPINGSRTKPNAALVKLSPASGLIGYPSYTGTGVRLRTLYNPAVSFMSTVEVQTSVLPANGKWTINALSHNLDSETPNGAWFTEMEGYRFGESQSVP